ncbi:MAG: SLC13 family permease [Dehalococcoidia bacterium]|nr:SLC13 family permease [Dehalococcoidia bacterium]
MAEILAVLIFLGMFTAIIIGRVHRYIPAIIGGCLALLVVFLIVMRDPAAAFKVLNLSQLLDFHFWWPGEQHVESHGINWQTVIFIGGMMVMVEGLGGVGFFRWLCLHLARLVRYRVIPLLVAFMLLSAVLSMFIDSITVLLFLASVTVELARLLKFDPVPVIVAEIFSANVGGSATMCGDPPNIIIGTALGYTFTDFAVNTGPIAWTAMVVTVIYFVLRFRGALKSTGVSPAVIRKNVPAPSEAVTKWPLFYANTAIFLIVVILLITHAETGMSVALIGVIAAFLTLLAGIKEGKHQT